MEFLSSGNAVVIWQVDGFKKAFHNACKEEKTATSRENSSKLDNNNPEAQRKLQEKVEKCQQEVHKVCVWRFHMTALCCYCTFKASGCECAL